jgi:formamidopyrimidine-DNA glycosylase
MSGRVPAGASREVAEVPEMPEVAALAEFLGEHALYKPVASLEIVAIGALKTFDPPPSALTGRVFTGVARHGKFLDLTLLATDAPEQPESPAQAAELHLVIHLARGGWLRWSDELPQGILRPSRKSPAAARLRFADDSGFTLTEAGTQKRLAVYLVVDPELVPGVARLGPDPLADDFSPEVFEGVLTAAGRAQLKGVLTDQMLIAGIGNAYSDEILHTAKLSPFKPAAGLTTTERGRLYTAVRSELTGALDRSRGLAAGDLKAEKKVGMQVHGRTGEACPVCGDVVREVSFADKSLQYCATCQTGGKPLADRRLSRLLK